MTQKKKNAKVFSRFKKDVDYDAEHVRPGPKGGTAPEFKCFNCDAWFNGNEWNYSFSKTWYPFLKHKINFLCSPKCSWEISEKHKEKYVGFNEQERN